MTGWRVLTRRALGRSLEELVFGSPALVVEGTGGLGMPAPWSRAVRGWCGLSGTEGGFLKVSSRGGPIFGPYLSMAAFCLALASLRRRASSLQAVAPHINSSAADPRSAACSQNPTSTPVASGHGHMLQISR